MVRIENLLPGCAYLPFRLLINRFRGRTEADVELLSKFIRPGDIVVDVGAHKGLYSIPLYNMGCTVYSFEPNAHCASLLASWASRKNRVHCFQVGLSDVSKTAELKIPLDETGKQHIASASVCKEFEGQFSIEKITLNRLDDFKLPGLSFLKIDVEGLEDKVVRGGLETIRKYRPVLLIEIEERHRSTSVNVLFSMLYEMGYKAFMTTQYGFNEVLISDIEDMSKLHALELSKNFWFVHGQANELSMTVNGRS
jgi:FkbM family methyltransferase